MLLKGENAIVFRISGKEKAVVEDRRIFSESQRREPIKSGTFHAFPRQPLTIRGGWKQGLYLVVTDDLIRNGFTPFYSSAPTSPQSVASEVKV